MVKVYLKDSGLLEVPYVASESQFDTFATATSTEKRQGEFRVVDTVEMNITNFQFASTKLNQGGVGVTDLRSQGLLLGQNPLTFNFTCELSIPHNNFTGTDTEDLDDYENLLLMSLSRGYKQLWLEDGTSVLREKLFSLYKAIKLFGVDDGSLANGSTMDDLSKKHLKLNLLSFNQNEGAGKSVMSYQVSVELLWDL
jgi:hypothetical protein